jgi:hypothetical protein
VDFEAAKPERSEFLDEAEKGEQRNYYIPKTDRKVYAKKEWKKEGQYTKKNSIRESHRKNPQTAQGNTERA